MKKQIGFVCFALGTALLSYAQTWDAVVDFSTTENTEQSVWSYRYKTGTVRDGNYPLLNVYGNGPNDWTPVNPGTWCLGGGQPMVGVNRSGSDVAVKYYPRFVWANGTMLVHPGNLNLVVLSWRSPQEAVVNITCNFTSVDPNGGNGIAWFVERNNSASTLLAGLFTRAGSSGLRNLSNFSVGAGDRINFIVDPNGDYHYDSTRIDATITVSVPQLSIDVTLTGLTVSWPAHPTDYVLEWCSCLTTEDWTAYPGEITSNGDTKSILLEPAGNKFFRLRKP